MRKLLLLPLLVSPIFALTVNITQPIIAGSAFDIVVYDPNCTSGIDYYWIESNEPFAPAEIGNKTCDPYFKIVHFYLEANNITPTAIIKIYKNGQLVYNTTLNVTYPGEIKFLPVIQESFKLSDYLVNGNLSKNWTITLPWSGNYVAIFKLTFHPDDTYNQPDSDNPTVVLEAPDVYIDNNLLKNYYERIIADYRISSLYSSSSPTYNYTIQFIRNLGYLTAGAHTLKIVKPIKISTTTDDGYGKIGYIYLPNTTNVTVYVNVIFLYAGIGNVSEVVATSPYELKAILENTPEARDAYFLYTVSMAEDSPELSQGTEYGISNILLYLKYSGAPIFNNSVAKNPFGYPVDKMKFITPDEIYNTFGMIRMMYKYGDPIAFPTIDIYAVPSYIPKYFTYKIHGAIISYRVLWGILGIGNMLYLTPLDTNKQENITIPVISYANITNYTIHIGCSATLECPNNITVDLTEGLNYITIPITVRYPVEGVSGIILYGDEKGIAGNGVWPINIVYPKNVTIEVDHPKVVPVGSKFYIRVRYKLLEGSELKYPFIAIDWNGTFSYSFGFISYDKECIKAPHKLKGGQLFGGTYAAVAVFLADAYYLTGRSKKNYTIYEAKLSAGEFTNKFWAPSVLTFMLNDPKNYIGSIYVLPEQVVLKTEDISAYIHLLKINSWNAVYFVVPLVETYVCKYASPWYYILPIKVSVYYKGESGFEPIGDWYKYGDTVKKGEWSPWYTFYAIAPSKEGEYTLYVILQDQIDTGLVWYVPIKIKVAQVESAAIDVKWDYPSKYYVGKEATIEARIEVTNVGGKFIEKVTKTLYIPYAKELKVIDDKGNVIKEYQDFSGQLNIEIKDIAPQSVKAYKVEIVIPTVKIRKEQIYTVVINGEKMRVKEMELVTEAPITLKDVVYTEYVDCSKIKDVTLNDKKVAYFCTNNRLIAYLGQFAPKDIKILRIYYKEGSESKQPNINVVVTGGLIAGIIGALIWLLRMGII